MTSQQSDTILTPLTYDDLIRRAEEIRSERADMIFHANLDHAGATRIAARAVSAAIDMWGDETGVHHTAIPEAMQIIAMARVIWLGWDEFYREQQPDFEEIWRGNALHEARGDLG
jgi:hypothetical protein